MRAVSPVVGVALLAAVTVVASAAVGAAALSVAPPDSGSQTVLDATADESGTVALVHRGGDTLSVSTLRVRLSVDGTSLRHQPPVPFVGAVGFDGAPSGPFNAAADGAWTAGERAAVRVAETNEPSLQPGRTVLVRVFEGENPVADVETTVQASTSASLVSASRFPSSVASSSGTRATVVIARGVPAFRCWMWCSNSVKPAAVNMRSASASS